MPMEERYQVSVIMPVYNEKKTIRRSIESILNQTLQEFEFLIINDVDSNDGTYQIVEEYKKQDARIKLIQKTENRGIAYSLNLGLELAHGKYIARMDADDFSYPKRFEKQYQCMEQHKEIDILGTNMLVQNISGECYDTNYPIKNEDISTRLLFENVLGHPSVMIRKDTVERLGMRYNPSYFAEDYELWLHYLNVVQFENLEESLLLYSQGRDTSQCTRHSYEMMKQINQLLFETVLQKLGVELTYYTIYRNLKNENRLHEEKINLVKIEEEFLAIQRANDISHTFEPHSLARTLMRFWNDLLWSISIYQN